MNKNKTPKTTEANEKIKMDKTSRKKADAPKSTKTISAEATTAVSPCAVTKTKVTATDVGKKSFAAKCGYVLMIILVITALGGLAGYVGYLSQRLSDLEQNIKFLQNNLSQNVDNNRKIYVFNMDEAVKSIGLQEANQKFEQDINELDAQVKEAQATIKDLKDEAVKAKILNLTIKPLQMKRDDLLQAYNKSMQDTLTQINTALAEIATENNVPVIFISKSVAVNTNYVVDVTPQAIEKIKAKQQ